MSMLPSLLLAPLSLLSVSSGAPDSSGAPAVQDEAPATSFTIEPIQVGEDTISVQEIKRALCYLVGTSSLEARKLDVFIAEEMRAQVEAGADPARFRVDAGEVEADIAEAEQQIREQYPTTPVETVLRSNMILDKAQWRDQLAQTKLFDLVFLPDDPDQWPDSTVEAMKNMQGGAQGTEFYDKIRESFRLANQPPEDGSEPDAATKQQQAAGQNLLRAILRQTVIGALTKNATVKLASDGLPPEVAMEVNGVQIMTDDLYESLAPRLTEQDYEQTRRWLVKSSVVEDRLREQGDWLSDEEFAAVYEEHEAPFAGSPISLQVLAVSFKRFPSLEIYKHYFRLLKSYERSIVDEITEEALRAHLPRANMLMGLAQVDLQAILVSAFDFGTQRWKEGGWEEARERAIEATRKLAEGTAWEAVLAEYSEFWDPPTPKDPQAQQGQQARRLNQGRIGLINRNELMQKLGESEYSMFLDGFSVSDYVFFDQAEGSLDGPFRGRYGYYITRVSGRTAPAHAMSLDNENQRELVRTDYLQMRFNRWAEKLMSDLAP